MKIFDNTPQLPVLKFLLNVLRVGYDLLDKLGTWLTSLLFTLFIPCLPIVVELLKKFHVDKENIVITVSVLAATFGITAGHKLSQVCYILLFITALLINTISGGLAAQMVADYSGTLLVAVALLHASERFHWHIVLDRPFP